MTKNYAVLTIYTRKPMTQQATRKTIATLLAEEVNAPSQSAQPISESAAIAPADPVHQSTAIAATTQETEGLFAESKQLWDELVAFDRENELPSKVGAQLWRLTKIVAKPIFIVT